MLFLSLFEVYLEKAFTDLALGPEERLPVARALSESSLVFWRTVH